MRSRRPALDRAYFESPEPHATSGAKMESPGAPRVARAGPKSGRKTIRSAWRRHEHAARRDRSRPPLPGHLARPRASISARRRGRLRRHPGRADERHNRVRALNTIEDDSPRAPQGRHLAPAQLRAAAQCRDALCARERHRDHPAGGAGVRQRVRRAASRAGREDPVHARPRPAGRAGPAHLLARGYGSGSASTTTMREDLQLGVPRRQGLPMGGRRTSRRETMNC